MNNEYQEYPLCHISHHQYMPDELKDENGKAYAYRDSEGNYYESEFGLSC